MPGLQVDNIKDGSATKTLATLSSSAVTLHSDVTFPADMIKNVQHMSNAVQHTTDSTTFVATNITDTITTTGSNKVLIIANCAGVLTGGGQYYIALTIYRGTTNLAAGSSNTVSDYDRMGSLQNGFAGWVESNVNMAYVDSPGAGTHTYTVRWGANSSSFTSYLNYNNQTSQMVLMELTA